MRRGTSQLASALEHYRKNPIHELPVTVDTEISEKISGDEPFVAKTLRRVV